MLQSIKQLFGNKLGTADGEIGHVKDFYFDDKSWAICYVVRGYRLMVAPVGRY